MFQLLAAIFSYVQLLHFFISANFRHFQLFPDMFSYSFHISAIFKHFQQFSFHFSASSFQMLAFQCIFSRKCIF